MEEKGKSLFYYEIMISSVIQTVKAWPIDPLDHRDLKLEGFEKLPLFLKSI